MKAESFRTYCDWPFTASTPADFVGMDAVLDAIPDRRDPVDPGTWDYREVDEAQSEKTDWRM